MTKQEEILQEIAEFLAYHDDKDWDELSDVDKFNYTSNARVLAVCLGNKGVVLKVDRELPKRLEYDKFVDSVGYLDCWKYSGLVAVESLIKEADDVFSNNQKG